MRRERLCSDSVSRRELRGWTRGWALLAMLAAMPLSMGNLSAQSGTVNRSPEGFPILPEDANPHPDGNRLMQDSMHAAMNRKVLAALNAQRQKQMTEDTAKLLTLASQLKTETAQANSNLSPILEIRKAEMIEKLARAVHEKMRATYLGNEAR